MTTMVPEPDGFEDSAEEFVPLTAEQARAFRRENPSYSPWLVVLGQLVVGVLVSLVVWGVSGDSALARSAAYGALTVLLPAALFARGLTGRFASLNPGSAVVGFFLWEMVKLALTIAMMIVAPRLVVALSWPAMLVGLVLTMKVYWVAMAFSPKKTKHIDG